MMASLSDNPSISFEEDPSIDVKFTNEKTYLINGQTFTSDQLKHALKQMQKNSSFSSRQFFKIFSYHLIHTIFSDIASIPVVFVLEGFDTTLLYNMQMLRRPRNCNCGMGVVI